MTSLKFSVAALLVCALASCQSTGRRTDSGDVGDRRVRVSGAAATVEDDGSITLNYPKNDDVNYRVPEWVINPAIGGVTGAVGVAATSKLGMREQIDQARWNGRLELASMLELRVQHISRSELEEDRRMGAGRDSGLARRDTLGIDKQILDMVLAGTRQRALWWDTDTGELFVWMVVDGAILKRVEHAVSQDVSVFTATAQLPSEYRPQRDQPLPPTVIVEMPDVAPEPRAPEQPQAPSTPVQKLEGALKDIETIPSKETGNDQ